jgi:hypothetical protein
MNALRTDECAIDREHDMTSNDTISARGRRLGTAAVCAATLGLGVIGHPAIAGAQGIDWNAYGDCLNHSKANDINVRVELCCIQAGGTIVADRDTGRVHCWSSEPTPEECKTVIGPHCTRQVPPVKVDPSVPTLDNPPVDPGLRTKPPIDPTPVQWDETNSNPS